jgi:hypothetical protein
MERERSNKELHTQRVSDAPTGNNPQDSNLASVEAMQFVLVYLFIGRDVLNISPSAAKMYRSIIMHVTASVV